MRFLFRPVCLLFVFLLTDAGILTVQAQTAELVRVMGNRLYAYGAPYYFVGTNYWYGGLLGLEKNKKRGIGRLRRELDLLKAKGVTNLRLMAGAEGAGLLNGVQRVGPPLQTGQGKFDESVLDGLDLVLYEMGRRRMKAVIFLSNNWEWSGGFQQYLIWNGVISDEWLVKKPTWDQLRDNVAKFYSCEPCKAAYAGQADLILRRENKYNRRKYTDDPTIMAWEIANEPRPMRPGANDAYSRWISETAAMFKSRDKNHLVTIGHEGWIGTQDVGLFEAIHADKNVDYLTIHIWPKNWGWFAEGKLKDEFPRVLAETERYIAENLAVAVRLGKPMVIEEFGLPRDGQSVEPKSSTSLRDEYYRKVLSFVGNQAGGSANIAGANFWAFGGTSRPVKGQLFWKPGDEYSGDPPMEEQGLNSVFDTDKSTWNLIQHTAIAVANGKRQ